MAFFIPSYLQKRLLKYALSRLEILDTDALDLASLDIAWGSRSTIEVRDVALKHQKLAALLQLPPQVIIEQTSVGLVRLTVPADLYTSSIVIEIDDVKATARLLSTQDLPRFKSTKESTRTKQHSNRQHPDHIDELPNARDLARSFLEQEPDSEKEELQAQVAAQSVDLQQSVASASNGDEDGNVGTGVELSLPAFLGNFLKSIGDRLLVNVHNLLITLQVDSKNDSVQIPTSLCLSLDTLNVQQATPDPSAGGDPPAVEKQTSSITHAGRSIRLENMRGFVVTDNDDIVGSYRGLERSQSAKGYQSPTHAWSPDVMRSMQMPYQNQYEASAGPNLTASLSSDMERSPQFGPTQSVESLGSRFADADDIASQDDYNYLHRHDFLYRSHSQEASRSSFSDSFQGTPSQLYDRLDSVQEGQHMAHPSQNSTQHRTERTNRAQAQSMANFAMFQDRPQSNADRSEEIPTLPYTSSDPAETTNALLESRLFSHEDAASIYMSVADMSNVSQRRESFRIPGAWVNQSALESSNVRPPNLGSESAAEEVARSTSAPSLSQTHDDCPSASNSCLPATGDEEPAAATVNSSRLNSHADEQKAHEMTLFTVDFVNIFIQEGAKDSTALDAETFQAQSSPDSLDTSTASSLLGKSSTMDVPGAFSSYADLTSRRRGNGAMSRSKANSRGNDTREGQQPHNGPPTFCCKVDAGTTISALDFNALPFLVQVLKKAHGAFSSQDSMSQDRKASTPESKPSMPLDLHVSIQRVVLDIQRSEATLQGPTVILGMQSSCAKSNDPSKKYSLLSLNLERMTVFLHVELLHQKLEFEIDSATVDIAGQKLISFDREASLSASMRGPLAPVKDISLTYSRNKLASDLNIVTLPILCDLDFHRIDDTLSSFGGLSGLIEAGSSMISDTGSTSPRSPPSERPRAVRFDSGIRPQTNSAETHTLRTNVRVNGGLVTLRGQHIAIQYRSSAIKVIKREAVLGFQIDEIIVDAPFKELQRPAFELVLRNLGVKYLIHPEEHDLSRLISLLTPSKDKFEEEDDLLLDTLLRQRRKGAAMRLSIGAVSLTCNDLGAIEKLQDFAVECSKLSITKYLPEESRPGLLTLGLVGNTTIRVKNAPKLGGVKGHIQNLEFAHVGAPSLVALSIQKAALERENGTVLVSHVLPSFEPSPPPMIMARMIGDELEPTVKLKFWNLNIEYTVPLAEALLGVGNPDPSANVAADLTASLAHLTVQTGTDESSTSSSSPTRSSSSEAKPLQLSLTLRDCSVALNPRDNLARALLVLTQARFDCALPKDDDFKARVDLRKASLLLINDASKLLDADQLPQEATGRRPMHRDQLSDLALQGYTSVSWISAAMVDLHLTRSKDSDPNILDVAIGDELLVLETCADSTATLGELFGGLSPALPPPKGERYRTEVASMQDMMASFTGDDFAVRPEESRLSFDDAQDVGDIMDDELAAEFDTYDHSLESDSRSHSQLLDDSISRYGFGSGAGSSIEESKVTLAQQPEGVKSEVISGDVRLAGMPAQVSPFAKKWDSTNNKYVHLRPSELAQSPVRIRLRDMHIIWNLYDGYDWEDTRDIIARAVHEVQAKAEERRANRRSSREAEVEDESVIGDFLFNSIYIGISANHDPRELTQQINREVDDMMTETGSNVSTAIGSRATGGTRPLRPHGKKLKLQRSKRHKIAFELRGVSADYFIFSPNQETQSSLDVRVKDLEIYDHVPTSTWKKFLTYSYDSGPREEKKPMVHLEVCEVRPIPELIASELVLRVTVLPVRLHVDQDTLDFMTRFFEFNDSSAAHNKPESHSQPYLQRVEVYPVPLKLDYKPKRVDYAGIRSGRTNEFKNFFVLDGAEMVLRHAIIYGTSGFQKLHHSLEDVWMPDILTNQLPSVLSGLNGVRTLVKVGSGMRDLVVVPIREYQKDGRIVRSISKGALAFARSTGGELTRFGAKLAVTAQTALQGAEDFLNIPQRQSASADREWEEADIGDSERRAISHYADQPVGLLQGLRGAARSLERDLLVTRDVIVAISGEVRESDSAQGAAKALVRHAPTLVLRPMIGASKAIGQTLMGANNSVDPDNRRRVEDKYKRY